MYYSENQGDDNNGEGYIVWQVDPDGVHFQEPQLIDECPGGEYHKQSIQYRTPNQAVMQFTGMHEWTPRDKQGKPIYEGDILRVSEEEGGAWSDPITVVVEYDDEAAMFVCKSDVELPYSLIHYEFRKIIGNVHENPELLKEAA
jgi:hypothetical protein